MAGTVILYIAISITSGFIVSYANFIVDQILFKCHLNYAVTTLSKVFVSTN